MSIVRIPESVTDITNTTIVTNKTAEVTDLETHVIVCSLRYEALEGRLERLEDKVNQIILQSANNNKMIIRTLLTIGTGVVSSLLVTYFKII